jgi:integrase/recombinase XerD
MKDKTTLQSASFGGVGEAFKTWLRQKRYMPSTISGHLKHLNYFTQWASENLPFGEDGGAENICRKDLLSYVQNEQQRGLDTATINLRLCSINLYFEYLKSIAPLSVGVRNPAKTLRIKGKLQKVVEQPLTYEEMENLYHTYKQLPKETANNTKEAVALAHQRNVVIVGMLVWQGLHSGELNKLETHHLKLDEGKIYIPGTARSNSRELHLHSQQIVHLHTYLNGGVRDKLMKRTKGFGEALFGANCTDIMRWLIEELKGIQPKIKNARHIRASVMLYWLKQYNKRQVQYMTGHRYIDSTEKYALQQTDTLTDLLTKHHPFG